MNIFTKTTRIFFFNDTATTEIYTLSLHDALPISPGVPGSARPADRGGEQRGRGRTRQGQPLRSRRDRKSTRLNSSHLVISYAVFCLKKKKELRLIEPRSQSSLWRLQSDSEKFMLV